MDGTFVIRVVLVLAVIVIALTFAVIHVYPTVKLRSLTEDQRVEMDPAELDKLRDDALKLGLDLQGGMHLVLEVDTAKVEDFNPEEIGEMVRRAETVIRNRVDRFGVSEPIIQTEGDTRIVVQLAGLTDETRAKQLIGRTALLEFKLVKDSDEFRRLLTEIDDGLKDDIRELTAEDQVEQFELELQEVMLDSLEADTTGLRSEQVATGKSLLQIVRFFRIPGSLHEDAMVYEKDLETVQEIFSRAEDQNLISPDVQILWDTDIEQGREGRLQRVYLLNAKASLTGRYIKTAIMKRGLESGRPSALGVSLEFNRVGRKIFSRVTGDNVDRRLAIVLDDKVHSAPNITEQIRGSAAITGSFTRDQARDLAIVLEAGALPVPLKIAEERSVGPSLGSDSIRRGVRAALIGGIAVALFMVIYYQASGLLAVLALVLNLIIIIAVLGGLRGTLTLPGIAGIILTIGIAVDANVLIFERIREELGAGKTVRRAIKDGYSRAFVTILDANVTTLITAGILYQFGTGPIRGFAVTLAIGIVASMFTAIVVTRTIYDGILNMRRIGKLSI
jgi:protein-export membrane protein SecD